jgi:hypothetical protein
MHHEAGVRVAVAGGRPSTGPMQAASGSRGDQEYSRDVLDANTNSTQTLLALQIRPMFTFYLTPPKLLTSTKPTPASTSATKSVKTTRFHYNSPMKQPIAAYFTRLRPCTTTPHYSSTSPMPSGPIPASAWSAPQVTLQPVSTRLISLVLQAATQGQFNLQLPFHSRE